MPALHDPETLDAAQLRALEADTNAVIKLILTEFDDLALLPPEQANEPYAVEERKRRIKRRLWEHHRAHVRALKRGSEGP